MGVISLEPLNSIERIVQRDVEFFLKSGLFKRLSREQKYFALEKKKKTQKSMILSLAVVKKSFVWWKHLFCQAKRTATVSFVFIFRLSLVWKMVHKSCA